MPELVEQMYCSQQIVVPPKYPYVLKRYCKAAIKTQPYDLLRWSYEYFKALAESRPPPVKLRLEYPIYSTEGGLTRGCLKVLANQLAGMKEVPITMVRRAWQGFCLDPHELVRILCYCEVHTRSNNVPLLHFVAVAGGMLTKCLTHTMVLLCETLTDDPDGGAAAISVFDFLEMYNLLAKMDASHDCKYIRGYREGFEPVEEVEEIEPEEEPKTPEEPDSDDYWEDKSHLVNLNVINDRINMSNRLSIKMNVPIIGEIKRSPSVERDGMIERENYLRERKERPAPSEEVDKLLQTMSAMRMEGTDSKVDLPPMASRPTSSMMVTTPTEGEEVDGEEELEQEAEVVKEEAKVEKKSDDGRGEEGKEEEGKGEEGEVVEEVDVVMMESVLDQIGQMREDRVNDLLATFEEISVIVDKFKAVNYDLGMVAGRQMSTTSGEFIVQHIEREIMDYINEQIAILPDPDLKRKKAKPEEVAMIRMILEDFMEENIDIICPEVEEVEEEEAPIPDIVQVYAVPGIGPPVDDEILLIFAEYARDVARTQADMFMPRNIRHFLCPPLEKQKDRIGSKIAGTGDLRTDVSDRQHLHKWLLTEFGDEDQVAHLLACLSRFDEHKYSSIKAATELAEK